MRKLRFISHFAEQALSFDSRPWAFLCLIVHARKRTTWSVLANDDKRKFGGEI